MMNRSSQPKAYYRYLPCGRNWAVYCYVRCATGSSGTKVGEYLTKEEARQKVYELSGWPDNIIWRKLKDGTMTKVYFKSDIPNDKPQWLLNVQQSVREAVEIMTLQGDERDYKNLKSFIDAAIQSQRSRGILTRSDVQTDLLTDNDRTVIRIFRNKDLVQSYFIE